MRTEHIEEFIDLAETLNFTRTAKHFYVTQPVLSKHIAGLEQELGGQLFDRGGGRMRLTAFGEALLPAARALVGWKDRLYSDARDFKASKAASAKVGFLQGAAGRHIAQIRKRFKVLFPTVELEDFTYEFVELFEALETGTIDLAIGGLTLVPNDDDYAIRKVYEDCYFALVDANSELASLQRITPADIAGMTLSIPARSFFDRDNEEIMAWLKPEENGITVREVMRDINSAPLFAEPDSLSMTFGHLAAFYGNEYEFVPVDGFDKTLDIVVAWRAENEKPFFEDFARITHEVIEEFGY